MRQGLDDAQGWQDHYCVYVNTQLCSRSGLLALLATLRWQHRCSTELLRASNTHFLVLSKSKARSSEKHQPTYCAQDQHSTVLCPQKPRGHDCHKTAKKWRAVANMYHSHSTKWGTQGKCQWPVLSIYINVSGTQILRGLNFCLVQKYPSHLNFHISIF